MFRLVIVALLTLSAQALFGGVTLDGSFGIHGALPGPNFIIPASVGKQVGGNLFQSFSQFNLVRSESATFTGPSNIQNILSRVTDGSPSSIDGKVSSEIRGANLFFLNPAGVIFRPHAQLDVSGSVAVTTANYVKLVGGGRFNASLGGQDTLTSAPVSSFGFLNSAPAPILVAGNNSFDSSGNIAYAPVLNVAAGKSFSLIAGGIGMTGGKITGEGSRMNLVSVHSAGEVILDATDINSSIDTSQFGLMGAIALINLANIDASGTAGGPVVVRGGSLVLDNSQIASETTGASQGGSMDIALSGDLKVVNGAAISTNKSGSGTGGNLSIHAASLLIGGSATPEFTGISAESDQGTGDAGNLTITVDRTLSIAGSGDIEVNTFSSGNGGNLTVQAGSVLIDGSATPVGMVTQIAAITKGSGNAGNVTITADKLVSIVGGADISTNTLSSGNAGDMTIAVIGALNIASGGAITVGTSSSGKGGNLSLHAGSLSIDGSAKPGLFTGISGNTLGIGDAGNLTVTVDRTLSLARSGEIEVNTFSSGKGGNLTVHAGSISIDDSGTPPDAFNTEIAAVTEGSGDAGNVTITADKLLRIVGGGDISVETLSSGNAGDLNIRAQSILIHGLASDFFSGIFAEANEGTGKGGNIIVAADNIRIPGEGTISASSVTSAPAGSVRLMVGKLSLDGFSDVSSFNGQGGTGPAGDVVVQASGPIRLSGDSSVLTSSDFANAGSIKIASGGPIELLDHSEITASAGANGGNIHVTSPQLLYLLNSRITATAGNAQSGGGTGGNITIDPVFIVLNNSLISANAAAGQGGNINLISDFFFASNSPITATGTTNNGTVNITAPELDLGAQLITLPSSLISAENQLRERCAALLQGDFSSFISIGRGGTEPEPDELQSEF